MPPSDELRPVTALFADIVGSTALGERLPPDEVQALVGECVTRMARAVEEFGGVVHSYMGDGICAVFGLPAAHEDDPERAARAALRIAGVVGAYARDVEAAWGIEGFDVRIGINGGQVAVAAVGGADPRDVALGDAMNVAARLQAATAPGTIAVGVDTARRLEARFALAPLGELAVKGRERPVATWRLVAPRGSARTALATPTVGREEELARLDRVLADLESGRGQVLLLVGEAGIGKTRLVRELEARAGEQVTWLAGGCSSYGGGQAYDPFVEALRAWLGVAEGETDVVVRLRLRARVGPLLGGGADEAMAVLGRLLGVRLDPELQHGLGAIAPDEVAGRVRDAYVAWLEGLTARGPVALVIEDVHWADVATRALAEEALRLTDRSPLLVVATLRPDPAGEGRALRVQVLTDYAHRATELPVGPLDATASHALLDRLLPGILDRAAREELVARAEGNPLYLEELLRAVVEGYGTARGRTFTITVGAVGSLPPALEGLLVARIDRLPEGARRLAQAAAIAGRVFSVRVLERALELDSAAADLDQLLRAEVVREVGRFPELECTFAHGLVKEAALATLTSERQRTLHGRVAEAIQELAGEAVDERLDQLAYHWGRSHDLARGLYWLERAALAALALDRREHAGELVARAIRIAERLGDPEARARLEALVP